MQHTNFPYGSEVKPYKAGTAMYTPFARPDQTFDAPIGQKLKKAYQWRVGFLFSSSGCIIFALLFLMVLNTSPFKVVVVSISEQGFVKQVSHLNNHYTIPERLYSVFLESVIDFKTAKFLKVLRINGKSIDQSQLAQTMILDDTQKKKADLSKHQLIEEANLSKNPYYNKSVKQAIKHNLSVYDYDGKGVEVNDFKVTQSPDHIGASFQFKSTLIYRNQSGFIRVFDLTGKMKRQIPQNEDKLLLNPLGIHLLEVNITPKRLKNYPYSGKIIQKRNQQSEH